MAKRICPYCKEKIKADATICKHCRKDLSSMPPLSWYKRHPVLTGLLVFCLVGIFGNILGKFMVQTRQTEHTKHVSTYNKTRTVSKKATIAKLENKVRKIPVSNASENLKIYQQLLSLNPKNQRYKKKVAFYEARVKEQKRKQQERVEREKRIAKDFLKDFRRMQQMRVEQDPRFKVDKTYILEYDCIAVYTRNDLYHVVDSLKTNWNDYHSEQSLRHLINVFKGNGVVKVLQKGSNISFLRAENEGFDFLIKLNHKSYWTMRFWLHGYPLLLFEVMEKPRMQIK